MKRLLRGVIDFGDGRVDNETRLANWARLFRSQIEWLHPDERKIHSFIREYVDRNFEPPNAELIREFFDRANELTVVDALEDIRSVPVFGNRTHYASLLQSLTEQQRTRRFLQLATDASEIATKGREFVEGNRKRSSKGVAAAITHLLDGCAQLQETANNTKLAGDLRTDTDAAWQAYQSIKGKGVAYGKPLGIDPIDTVCHGIKKGELWVHAGFAGHLKTSFALNWAYHTVTRYRGNVLYVSLEMRYDQLQRMVYTLHSSNGLFRELGQVPLDYRLVRDGQLTTNQEAFYKTVLGDFSNNKKYQHFEIWAPDRPVTIPDIRIHAEHLHRQMEVSLVFVDHAGLVRPTEKDPNFGVRMNSIFRDAKLMALQFNGGEGVPVVLLHQLSREGLKEADKRGGQFALTALSWANEAERSADVVSTSYLSDELRAAGETLVANLKNRDNPHFPLTRLSIDWRCRRLFWDPSTAGISCDAPEEDYDRALLQAV